MTKFFIFSFVIMIAFISCSQESHYLTKMNNIKAVGDTNPTLAFRMLDSIKLEVRHGSKYMQVKYDLLEIRLKDKLYIEATSDLDIKNIVAYFNENGNDSEKKEAYYYAGSVYRDLHDTPRSLEYFLRALDFAEKECPYDSLMLRNIYSNLHCLYYDVQDYRNALKMMQKEYYIAEKMNKVEANEALNMGATLIQLNNKHAAKKYFVKAWELMKNQKHTDYNLVSDLLYQFAKLGEYNLAKDCYQRIEHVSPSSKIYLSLGTYFQYLGKDDKASYFLNKVIAGDFPLEAKYDAAHLLFEMNKGNTKFAILFMQINDSLNLGERQFKAATVNNLYQYHKDMNSEREIKQENITYHNMLIISTFCLILSIILAVLVYVYKKYKYTKRIVEKDKKYNTLIYDLKIQKSRELEKEKELKRSYEAYQESQRELEKVNSQLYETRNELAKKRKELEERVSQTTDIMRQLNQSKLTTSSEEVINFIKTASKGTYKMKPADWLRVYQATDKLFPTFSDELIKKISRFNEQQKQVCYLLRIGLTNSQIENIMGLSHATIWRWVKKYREILHI